MAASTASPSLAQTFYKSWRQHEAAVDALAVETTNLTACPTAFTASPTFATAHTPWYLDYGHLTFWFFFFASGVIVLWIAYSFISLTRNVEARRVVRETRGYSRAQTGDTVTAVLPLTWSVTMLAHAGTHSSNFDENTNATVFSFTVIAYQWGWNYFFPREIAELLSGAPRLVGRGHVVGDQVRDPYSLLLARARRDYIAQLAMSERYAARHGRYAMSSVLQLLLPTSIGSVPAWAQAGVEVTTTPWEGGDTFSLVGHQADIVVHESSAALMLQRWGQLTRGLGVTGVSHDASLVSAVVESSSLGAALLPYGYLPVEVDEVPAPVVAQPTRPLASAAWVGNRLARIHAFLATGIVENDARSQLLQAATLLDRLWTTGPTAALQASPLDTGVLQLGPVSFANVGTVASSAAVATNPWVGSALPTVGGATLIDSHASGTLTGDAGDVWAAQAAPQWLWGDSTIRGQAATRSNLILSLTGANTQLAAADRHTNVAAAAAGLEGDEALSGIAVHPEIIALGGVAGWSVVSRENPWLAMGGRGRLSLALEGALYGVQTHVQSANLAASMGALSPESCVTSASSLAMPESYVGSRSEDAPILPTIGVSPVTGLSLYWLQADLLEEASTEAGDVGDETGLADEVAEGVLEEGDIGDLIVALDAIDTGGFQVGVSGPNRQPSLGGDDAEGVDSGAAPEAGEEGEVESQYWDVHTLEAVLRAILLDRQSSLEAGTLWSLPLLPQVDLALGWLFGFHGTRLDMSRGQLACCLLFWGPHALSAVTLSSQMWAISGQLVETFLSPDKSPLWLTERSTLEAAVVLLAVKEEFDRFVLQMVLEGGMRVELFMRRVALEMRLFGAILGYELRGVAYCIWYTGYPVQSMPEHALILLTRIMEFGGALDPKDVWVTVLRIVEFGGTLSPKAVWGAFRWILAVGILIIREDARAVFDKLFVDPVILYSRWVDLSLRYLPDTPWWSCLVTPCAEVSRTVVAHICAAILTSDMILHIWAEELFEVAYSYYTNSIAEDRRAEALIRISGGGEALAMAIVMGDVVELIAQAINSEGGSLWSWLSEVDEELLVGAILPEARLVEGLRLLWVLCGVLVPCELCQPETIESFMWALCPELRLAASLECLVVSGDTQGRGDPLWVSLQRFHQWVALGSSLQAYRSGIVAVELGMGLWALALPLFHQLWVGVRLFVPVDYVDPLIVCQRAWAADETSQDTPWLLSLVTDLVLAVPTPRFMCMVAWVQLTELHDGLQTSAYVRDASLVLLWQMVREHGGFWAAVVVPFGRSLLGYPSVGVVRAILEVEAALEWCSVHQMLAIQQLGVALERYDAWYHAHAITPEAALMFFVYRLAEMAGLEPEVNGVWVLVDGPAYLVSEPVYALTELVDLFSACCASYEDELKAVVDFLGPLIEGSQPTLRLDLGVVDYTEVTQRAVCAAATADVAAWGNVLWLSLALLDVFLRLPAFSDLRGGCIALSLLGGLACGSHYAFDTDLDPWVRLSVVFGGGIDLRDLRGTWVVSCVLLSTLRPSIIHNFLVPRTLPRGGTERAGWGVGSDVAAGCSGGLTAGASQCVARARVCPAEVPQLGSHEGAFRILDTVPTERGGAEVSMIPVPTSTWLEGASETQLTRVTAAPAGDILQFNARNEATSLTTIAASQPELRSWRELWVWQAASQGFPWDRTFRAQLARRPMSGGAGWWAPSEVATERATLALQRQRFDKNLVSSLLPRVERITRNPQTAELGRAVLDTERGSIWPVWAVILPSPHLDIDPTFMHMRWSSELNMSRRSDHDARFRVLWGPLAAAWASPQLADTARWGAESGPVLTTGLGSRVFRELALLSQRECSHIVAAEVPAQARLASTAFDIHGGLNRGLLVQRVGGSQAHLTSAVHVIRQASKLVVDQPQSRVGRGSISTNRGLGAWSRIWAYVAPHSRLGGHGGMTGSADSHRFWLARLIGHLEVFNMQLSVHAQRTGAAVALAPYLQASGAHPLVRLLTQTHPTAEVDSSASTTTRGSLRPRPYIPRAGYTPIEQGIASQRRLRVTKGIYLPSDIPMHGIFGSKDVIHSWAIPGLGVKIDCIPGYSSHRRLVFRWRGLYWGQCMEVCGRYHHWMPILVRIVHKDVFLLWCLSYLRLVTLRSMSESVVPSLSVARSLWSAATQIQAANLPTRVLVSATSVL